MTLQEEVFSALAEAGLASADRGAAALSLVYAGQIDAGEDVDKLGPLLLAALESLGMTPRARAALTKGANNERAQSPLDELRARRAARQHGAATVDATAS